MNLREIIAGVEGQRQTLALYNVDAPGAVIDAVGEYFRPQQVSIRRSSTEEGVPSNFAVLHDDDKCALLARETAQENTYRGFWTYRATVVDAILDRLRGAYLQ